VNSDVEGDVLMSKSNQTQELSQTHEPLPKTWNKQEVDNVSFISDNGVGQ
jgi:hypothetical protein